MLVISPRVFVRTIKSVLFGSMLGGHQRRTRRIGSRASARSAEDVAGFVERIEDRILLTTGVWDGGGDAVHWNDAANWSDDTLPSASDDVSIGAFAGASIIVSGADVSVHSLNTSHAIELSGVTFSIATSSLLNDTFTLAGGTLIGGTYTVNAGAGLIFTSSGGKLGGVHVIGETAHVHSGILIP